MQHSNDAGRRHNRHQTSKRPVDAHSSPEPGEGTRGGTGVADGASADDRAGAAKGAGAAKTGSTDESIGRPGNWREGRYQRRGAPVDQSVNDPSQSTQSAPKSPPAEDQKPVTLRDYEK